MCAGDSMLRNANDEPCDLEVAGSIPTEGARNHV
jgi:hypothetical protein